MSNYNDEQVAQMVAAYIGNPTRDTVSRLAAEMEKSERSIIAKLSREGVYIAQVREGKKPKDVITKKVMVDRISQATGINFTALDKASRDDLISLLEVIEG